MRNKVGRPRFEPIRDRRGNTLGRALKVARTNANLTQAEAADLGGVSRVAISAYERDEYAPTPEVLTALMLAYEVLPDSFGFLVEDGSIQPIAPPDPAHISPVDDNPWGWMRVSSALPIGGNRWRVTANQVAFKIAGLTQADFLEKSSEPPVPVPVAFVDVDHSYLALQLTLEDKPLPWLAGRGDHLIVELARIRPDRMVAAVHVKTGELILRGLVLDRDSIIMVDPTNFRRTDESPADYMMIGHVVAVASLPFPGYYEFKYVRGGFSFDLLRDTVSKHYPSAIKD